ncbi:MAG: S8 family serine peptidase [Chloroflexi bacterium]|nr:S8 family serine peptidase [Chloroflexota bacterium]
MRRSVFLVMAIGLSSLLTIGPSVAGTASISIDSVGGNKIKNGAVQGTLFGKTLVSGTAIPGSVAPAPPQAKPLVADAGDSGFVPSGGTVTLLGTGYGGTSPYSFAWTASAGALAGADAATAQVDTTSVAPGTYTASLTITDSTGATAFDMVKYVVSAASDATLLDQSKADLTPGVLGAGAPGTISFPFTVPVNTVSLVVRISWGQGVNDYDLRVIDANGAQACSNGDGVPTTSETCSPTIKIVPGAWTVAVDKFATVTDTVRAVVTAKVATADPRPVVSSGGPYKFAVGTTQAIAGSVSGGTAPVSVGWDTDEDGVLDRTGTSFTGVFPEGRRIITIRATDAAGLERRETTSVLVARPDRLAAETTALTVIAVNDTGVNPYHLEYSATTYPDPDVLALTANFTKHPSEYISGYPKDAQAIPATLGKGYFPVDDARGPDANGDGVPDGSIWDLKSATKPWGLEYGKLYWIPGTKIVGAIQPGSFACSNCAAGSHVILDDDGHGSGSTSVSTGNRYGYCPTCLLVISKGLSGAMVASTALPWVDVNSNSWGTVANAPLDLGFQLLGTDPGKPSRDAVERGQTVLFAAGNGTANAFDTTSPVYGTSTAGPDWNVVVGAIRRDNERAIVGDGTPAHLSSWGDGNLPSACRTGTVSQCAFGGTSAATPYTAGIFGTVLTSVRRQLGDGGVGQRAGQVIAEGFPVAGSAYLADGKLTRAELREAVLKTAFPLNQDNTQSIPIFPYPWTAPYNGDINVIFEGYGAATPNSAKRAVDVLLGKAALPTRDAEDRWFAIDRQIRDSLWGGYDRDGNGSTDSFAALGAFGITEANVRSADAQMIAIAKVANAITLSALTQTTGANTQTFWLHRSSEGEPQLVDSCGNAVEYMDQSDTSGDRDPCFSNRATSVLAAYRPLGIWPASSDTTAPLPAGSTVTVELWVALSEVSVLRPTGVLMAGDRVLGTGSGTPTPAIGSGLWISQGFPVNPNLINGAPTLPTGVKIDQNKCKELGEACWNKLTWSFTTTRHAIAGEQLTFQAALIGARAFAFGYEAQHRSKISIDVASAPAGELDFGTAFTSPAEGAKLPDNVGFDATGSVTFPALGTTEAGDHPTLKRVYVSVDDATFANPTEASVFLNDGGTRGTWRAPIGGLAAGAHTIYARAQIDTNASPVSQRSVTVEDVNTTPRVQYQIVRAGTVPIADGWKAATGLLSYSFEFDTRTYGKGDFTINVRLIEGGLTTATASLNAKFR